jgi:proteasome accessory factor C
MEMDKWEKIVLVHRLLSKSHYCISSKALLTKLECSEATFHRIRTFMQTRLSAPIVFDHRYGGYCYETIDGQPFELPGLWFTQNEIEALLGFHHAVESLQKGFFSDVLAPIKKRFEPLLKAQKTQTTSFLDRIKIIPLQSRNVDEKLFRMIAEAVVAGKRLRIEHAKISDESPIERSISPQTLVRYRDNWYVDAFCHLRNELRTFALDRILSVDFDPGKYHRTPRKQCEDFFGAAYGIFTGPATQTAEILFRGPAAREVSREQWHPRQQGQWKDDKTYCLTIPYGEDQELLMDIFKWGDCAEIINPQKLRNKAKLLLSNALANYNK